MSVASFAEGLLQRQESAALEDDPVGSHELVHRDVRRRLDRAHAILLRSTGVGF